MSPVEAFRFVLWAQGHGCEGRNLTHREVMDRWECSRATAYRLLGYYFDAKCFPPRRRAAAQKVSKAPRESMEHPWSKRAIA